MKKVLLLIVLMMLMIGLTSCKKNDKPIDNDQNDKIEEYLKSMSTRDKVSQMLMMSCRRRDGENLTSMKSEIYDLVKEYGFGGIILFAENTNHNEDIFNLIDDYQKASKEGTHPGLLMAVDQEGGRVVRLNEACITPGNMALGADGNTDDVKTIASLIASEVSSLGFNVDFAPVTDINNNPNNPIIGVRSFSDDKMIVSNMVKAYLEGLKEHNVIGSLKHFPGHGDTGTDSHTGLPLIDKNLEELLDFELVPYKNNIKDIDMIMTAHIVYPQIETNTYKSKSSGEYIYLPATLSKTIITDVLRGELGYDGVVVTDALDMAAIAQHFDPLDAAKLAINAGVDILLMPADISTDEGINQLKKYIDDIVEMVEDGSIDINNIDKAVTRILKLKEKYNILEYKEKDISKIDNVGSKANHDIEWDITKKVVTLLKNDNALPFEENDKVLIVTTDSSQTNPIQYALDLAQRKTNVSVVEIEEALSRIDLSVYDKILILSQMGNNKYLNSSLAESIDSIIASAKLQGKKTIILSTNLPYDVSRFKDADALVVCYSPKGMELIPNPKDSQIIQYGPNIPCAIYMMFNDSTYSARLPIIIYELDENYEYTNNILFNRGFGLDK